MQTARDAEETGDDGITKEKARRMWLLMRSRNGSDI
jgi:hypothetical protein